MPPRKRARLSAGTSPIPDTSPTATPLSGSRDPSATPTPSTYWSIAQQTALFKALIAAKPTGPHKHFHMLTVAQNLSQQLGYYMPVDVIRDKLLELYDLEALDRQEEQYAFRTRDARGDWLPEIYEAEFGLPGEPTAEQHGGKAEELGSDEEEAVDEDAIAQVWGAKDADEAWFVEEVWKRRLADGEEEDDQDERAMEASPAPSTAASTTRRARPARTTRLSEIKAEDDDEGGDEDEEADEDEDDDGGKSRLSTRQSARATRKGKKK